MAQVCHTGLKLPRRSNNATKDDTTCDLVRVDILKQWHCSKLRGIHQERMYLEELHIVLVHRGSADGNERSKEKLPQMVWWTKEDRIPHDNTLGEHGDNVQ